MKNTTVKQMFTRRSWAISGSKSLLRIFRSQFKGCFCMDFFHTFGNGVLTVADVDCGLLILLSLDGHKIRDCAVCYGS